MIHIDKDILQLEEAANSIRRDLHKIPETGFQEYKTATYIKEKLLEFGVDTVDSFMETGVVAVIKGKHQGGVIAFRADMDGLPVTEETSRDFQSINPNMMHACGHDGHMTMLLLLTKYLVSRREQLAGNVVLLFQPAEEGPGGAEPIVKSGILDQYGVQKIIGSHIFPEFPQGFVASRKGPMMARNGEVTITVKGSSAHGAQPQKGIDALVCAAAIVSGLQTLVSRNMNPFDTAVLTLGTIHGGEAKNIIAKEVTIGGTMRAFDDTVYELLTDRVYQLTTSIAEAYGCEVDVDFFHMYHVVNNDSTMVDILKKAVGAEGYIEAKPVMISEDSSFYQEHFQGIFFFLGSRNEERDFIHSLHSAYFDFDEKTLLYGVQAYKGMLKELKFFDSSL